MRTAIVSIFVALAGLGLSAVSLIIFGGSHFIIPAMIAILGILTAFKKPLEKVEAAA